ncbi:hypothetical protein [Pedobacter sp. L105]|uniref:hypothetical protein n=1 Tax=Pedobacter sp. L105 TaxID=1641871 RepID=UPI00131B1B12|nr:hypothetical protein [Pedobacter sp. L105]
MNEANVNDHQLNEGHRDLVSFVLVGHLNSKLKNLSKDNGYHRYIVEEDYTMHYHSIDNFVMSTCSHSSLTSFLNLKKALKTWTALPAPYRLEVMLNFREHMVELYPAKKRHFKMIVFCRVFMHEFLPILSTGNN